MRLVTLAALSLRVCDPIDWQRKDLLLLLRIGGSLRFLRRRNFARLLRFLVTSTASPRLAFLLLLLLLHLTGQGDLLLRARTR